MILTAGFDANISIKALKASDGPKPWSHWVLLGHVDEPEPEQESPRFLQDPAQIHGLHGRVEFLPLVSSMDQVTIRDSSSGIIPSYSTSINSTATKPSQTHWSKGKKRFYPFPRWLLEPVVPERIRKVGVEKTFKRLKPKPVDCGF